MITVAALTSGRDVPSARLRIRQHIDSLKGFDISVREYCPVISKSAGIPGWPKDLRQRYLLLVFPLVPIWNGIKVATRIPGLVGSYRNQITWINKQLLGGYMTWEPFLKRPFVLDVDDAIWAMPPFGKSAARATARKTAAIMAGNNYIANWFDKYSNNIHIIPTAIDTERYQPRPNRSENFTIGWIGTQSTLPYLKAIEKPLSEFLKTHENSKMFVIADDVPYFPKISGAKVRFCPWSEESEAKSIQQMDVGLMPLPDTESARGKCSFKMLQYMACGIPVVVSPVGMNAEILAMDNVGLPAQTDEDWYESLSFLYKNQEKAREMGKSGRTVAKNNFDRRLIAEKIAHVFLELG